MRRRFEHPISDIGELRRTQDAVRFFTRHPQLVRLAQKSVERVDRYLGSNIVLAPRSPLGGRLEYAWVAFRYRDLIQELREGINETLALLEHLGRTGKAIEDRDPPDLIAQLGAELRRVAVTVPRGPVTSTSLLAVDRACRATLRSDIERALGAMAELDALNSLAQSTAALGWTMPEVVESESFLLDATGAFHPFLANPVRNPVSLSGDRALIFLTGPNMAGKTTYLRCSRRWRRWSRA